MAKITLIGLELYQKADGKSIFDKLILPEGIDKDLLVDSILLRAGEFEVLYSNPDFMTDAVRVWSGKYLRTFTKWLAALNIEYNPLENYDRLEDWTDDTINTGTTTDQNTGHGTMNSENKTSAFDSNTYQPHDLTSSATTNDTNSVTNVNATNNTHRVGRAHGNIGVTTSQQMLTSELEVAVWSLYEHIADLFVSEFCLMVY